jgi:hypothetical protein
VKYFGWVSSGSQALVLLAGTTQIKRCRYYASFQSKSLIVPTLAAVLFSVHPWLMVIKK